jgi:cyclohexa-1,5-dienecarbonyl-CoA hydratase
MSNFTRIRFTQEGKIARITLRDEPSNIIGFEMMAELSTAIRQARSCTILILDSAMPHFSNGVDIRIHTPELAARMLTEFHKIIRDLYHFDGVTICLLKGNCLGGGLEIALVCDFILADLNASLGFPEIRLACFPPVASVLLPLKIGRRANALLFTGKTITSEEASALGLLDGSSATVEDLIKTLSSLSPDALRSLKRAVLKSQGFDFDKALKAAEQIYLEELLNSAEMSEGIRAFLEKRTPHF